MANTLVVTTGKVAKRALAVLHDKLLMPAWIDRQYSKEYAVSGAKVGNTVRVRVPTRITTALQSGNTPIVFGTVNEDTVTLTLSRQRAVPLEFTQQELTLDMDDFSAQVIEPAASQLASDLESDILADVTPYVANAVIATGSSNLSPKWIDILNCGAKMSKFLAPTADRYVMIDPLDEVAIVDELKGLFQDSSMVAQQNLEGYVGRTAGFLWGRSNRLPTLTIGAQVGFQMGAQAVEGSNQISVDGLDTTQVVEAGTVISIAGVNALGPETKADLGFAKQFSVIETVTAVAGAATLKLNEKIYFGATANKNVSAVPEASDAVTILGAAGATYRQVLCFQKNAFTLATADLMLPRAGATGSREAMDGLTLSFVQSFDTASYSELDRLDCIYGSACLRPGFAAKILVKVS